LAFIEVETGGQGFDSATGKIMIQFEPSWFKKNAPYAPSGLWSVNKVEKQAKEWAAFNDAYSKNKQAALLSTSIGLGQIMGFNFVYAGHKNVNEMWDEAKKSLYHQVIQICNFIKNYPGLLSAIKSKNWDKIATLYNGAGYKKLAAQYGREPYDKSLEKAYNKYKLTIYD